MVATVSLPLAVTEDARRGLSGVVLWSAVLVVLILVAFLGYTLLRRWMRPADEGTAERGGFTLSELRRMHKAGELSDEEFEATRAQLIGAAKRMTDRMPAVLGRPDEKPPDEKPPGGKPPVGKRSDGEPPGGDGPPLT